ncbi:hypothetical protein [Piscirickettsia litoralis]|uniref:Uncharacterized protein n=1 Tax=Piscirickettsia litoralis TaxID=1891921 RepID=A0ABX3A759_9GAMM|nr:hypothetical protein [Piscirickettsia litoralis]ODN43355.1 hypothetical protein BGC07_10995 [Piscirickettsia litoralis]
METAQLTNGKMQLDYLVDAGPRLTHLSLVGGANIFADLGKTKATTSAGDFIFYGGHRLWHAPEAKPRSYLPDNTPPEVQRGDLTVTITGQLEEQTGLQKEMQLKLQADRAELSINHVIYNRGLWPIECAPWGITQLKTGGVAILPQYNQPFDEHGLLPNRQLNFWPYSDYQDERLELHQNAILVHGKPISQPFKIGYLSVLGWSAYLYENTLLIKQFEVDSGMYPDFNSNSEVYSNDQYLELETLGTLRQIAPGQSHVQKEVWRLFKVDSDIQRTPDALLQLCVQQLNQ